MLGAKGHHTEHLASRHQGKDDVRPDAVLQELHVFQEAVGVKDVLLKDGFAFQNRVAHTAPHQGHHRALAPALVCGVGDELHVIAAFVDETAGEAVEVEETAHLLGEGRDHRGQIAARGQCGGETIQSLEAMGGRPHLGIPPAGVEA